MKKLNKKDGLKSERWNEQVISVNKWLAKRQANKIFARKWFVWCKLKQAAGSDGDGTGRRLMQRWKGRDKGIAYEKID